MKNFLIKKQENLRFILQQAIIVITSLALAISPFVVDYSNLPSGFELPKVMFFQAICVVIVILSILNFGIDIINNRDFAFKKGFLLTVILSLIFLLSSLLSDFKEVSLWGNSFRFQGFFTYFLIIWAIFAVYKSISKKNWHILSLSVIASTIVQSFVALNQFKEYVAIDPNIIKEGVWINGTFGQANWFAGRILIAIILCCFYIGLNINAKKTSKILFKFLFGFILSLFITTLGLTFSIWGIISATVAIICIVLYEALPKKVFGILVLLMSILSIFAMVIFTRIGSEYNLRIDIYNSIVNLLTQPINLNQLRILLFGFGFDTLVDVFRASNLMAGVIVDRAHNFIFDIIISTGFLSLGVFLFLVKNTYANLIKNNKNRILDYCAIAIILWMFRSLVHENGIVNTMDFFVILSSFLGLHFKRLH